MVNMRISENILCNRKRIGYTQQALADFLNISKSAVSKWEQGRSIPEIKYLGQLSILFDTSIDELVGFSSDLSKRQIRVIYNELAEKFTVENYGDVLETIKCYSKKYYNCYPFLSTLVGLLINHMNMVNDKEDTIELAGQLIERILSNSDSLHLKEQMTFFKAMLLIAESNYKKVIDLLKDSSLPKLPNSSLLAQSYLMTGESDRAKATLQVEIYENLIFMMSDLTMIMHSNLYDDLESVISKGVAIDQGFNLKNLHPNTTLNFYLVAAMKTAADKERCIIYLKEFLRSTKNLYEDYYLHGDEFFTEIDDWIADFVIGKDVPVNKNTAKQQLLDSVGNNPAFKDIKDDIAFKNILHNLKIILKEEEI